MSRAQTVSTYRSLLRIFTASHRHAGGPIEYNFQMQSQWRGHIMEQYRANQFETDKQKVKQMRTKAEDLVTLYDTNLDLKYLRFLDTGIKPFISETDRIRTAAIRVGLQTTDVETPE